MLHERAGLSSADLQRNGRPGGEMGTGMVEKGANNPGPVRAAIQGEHRIVTDLAR